MEHSTANLIYCALSDRNCGSPSNLTVINISSLMFNNVVCSAWKYNERRNILDFNVALSRDKSNIFSY